MIALYLKRNRSYGFTVVFMVICLRNAGMASFPRTQSLPKRTVPTIAHSRSLPQPPSSHSRAEYDKQGSATLEHLGRAPAPAPAPTASSRGARAPIVRNAQGKPMTPLEIDLEEADKILRRATMLDKRQFADADRRKNAESAAKVPTLV